MADIEDRLNSIERILEKFGDNLDQTSNAAQDVTKSLTFEDSLRKAANKQTKEYNEQVKESIRQERARERAWDATKNTASKVVDSFFSVTQSVYTSTEAFSAISPVIQAMTDVSKGLIEAIGMAASGVSVFGFSFGKLPEAMAKGLTVGLDLINATVQQQIKSTQMLVNNLNALSGAGATFGGSLTKLQKAAVDGGISVETYTKIVTKNAEDLARLGGSVELGARQVTRLSNTIATNNKQLLTMYGSFENLNQGVADFMAMQTSFGATNIRNNKDLEKSAKEYLYQQKALSELTGQSVDAMKKREQERQTVLAYQNAEAMMTANELQNSRTELELARKQGGEKLERAVMEEIIARKTGVRVYSEDTMLLQATHRDLWNTHSNIVGALDQSADSFVKYATANIKSSADAVEANNRNAQMTTLSALRLTGHLDGASAKFADVSTSVGSASLRANEWARNVEASNLQLKDNIEEGKKDPSMKLVADAIGELERFKVVMDTQAIKGLESMSTWMKVAYNSAELLAMGLDKASIAADILAMMVSGKEITKEDVERFQKRFTSTTAASTEAGVPKMVEVKSKTGASAMVAESHAKKFQELIDYADSIGYEIKSLSGFSNRDVRGRPGVKSVHAWGGALDINAATNPMRPDLVTDMPANLVAKARELGLGWGGDWKTRKDPMHFSADAREGGKETAPIRSASDADPNPRALVEYLQELISVNKDIRDTNEQILQASA